LKNLGFVPILGRVIWNAIALTVAALTVLSLAAIPMWATWTTVREHRVGYSVLAGLSALAWMALLVASI
jgi:uncharacterized membrane protein YqjE